MRLKGDRIEISGVAADAAALVKHIEQSPHFSRAVFTAPTTRGADDKESFRIEAHVAPLFQGLAVNAAARRALSALGLCAAVALALGAAAATALALRQAQGDVALLGAEAQALQARETRLGRGRGGDRNAAPFFQARSITLAGAALQQRIEAAISAAHGRLISSKVDVAPRGGANRIDLSAELTIAENDMQALLFDLETGRPYLFVDAFEARAPEGAGTQGLRVSLSVSGQWSRSK